MFWREGAEAEQQETSLRKADAGLMKCDLKAGPLGNAETTPVWWLAPGESGVTTCNTLSFAEGFFMN